MMLSFSLCFCILHFALSYHDISVLLYSYVTCQSLLKLSSLSPPEHHSGHLTLWRDIRGCSLSLFLSYTLFFIQRHVHSQMLAQKTNVRPKTVQREHCPTKVMLRVVRRHCHLCPTWMHSDINAARRKPIWPPVWLKIQQGQLVQPGNTHALPRE